MTNEEQIHKWAEEAEADYDVEELKAGGGAVPDEGPSRCRGRRSA